MTAKADFTEPEWQTLVRAPLVAGMAISLADPGGPIEAVKESTAVVKVVSQEMSSTGLNGDVARDLADQINHRKNPLGDFKPRGATAGKEIVDELARVRETVDARATPEDANQFRELLLNCARRAAEAAKEGGFMGFNAVRVSEGEQRMLSELASTLGVETT
jgi:hypothetical protein